MNEIYEMNFLNDDDTWVEDFCDSVYRDEKDLIAIKLKSGEWKVNVFDKNGFSPLYTACRYLHVDIVSLLIQYGADVNEKSGFRESTPLDITVSTIDDIKRFNLTDSTLNGLKIIHLLLENNANVNCQNKEGLTPLQMAYKTDLKEVINILLENKSNKKYIEFRI